MERTRKMAGIKDIAKKARCSISTVSYALNGSPKVTAETRERVLQIAKELNYVPNAAARMLRARETKIIGCFLSDYSGSFYGRLLKGMRETLNAKGYELIVCSGEKSRRLLLEKMMDGAVILDASFSDEELLHYADLGHKMILLDRELGHEHIKTVRLDNQNGVELALSEVLRHEVRELYVLSGPSVSYDSQQRMQAVRKIMQKNKMVQVNEVEGDFTKESGVKLAKQIMVNYSGVPIAVFCLNDEMAIGFYDYFKETPYVIGEHIYLVGFDNIELAAYMIPRLTTVDYSTFEWGKKATDNLLKLLLGEVVKHEKVDVKLTKGGSC
jgi:LacI family transcriptional regulator